MKNLFLSALAFVAISFASCGGDSCDAADITAAVDNISTTLTAYTADDSKENCEAYRDALNDYINDLKDCDGVSQTTIDGFQDDVDALTCE